LIASKIAAHAADIVKGVPGARERDYRMSQARKRLDWDAQCRLSIDPVKFKRVRATRRTHSSACSMCGDFCAMRIVSEFLGARGKAHDNRC
jgi:phosphomethylpyrimidine synthase